MILINLLGTKHADVNLEWEVNELLQAHKPFAAGEFTFSVERQDHLPFAVEGLIGEGALRFSFDDASAVLQIDDGSNEIELEAPLDTPETVRIHFQGATYDSRAALAKDADLLNPDNLLGVISMALQKQGGEEPEEAAPGLSRENLHLLANFAKKKMREAVTFFQPIVSHVLSPQQAETDDLKAALASLDLPLPTAAKKKKAKSPSRKASAASKKKGAKKKKKKKAAKKKAAKKKGKGKK